MFSCLWGASKKLTPPSRSDSASSESRPAQLSPHTLIWSELSPSRPEDPGEAAGIHLTPSPPPHCQSGSVIYNQLKVTLPVQADRRRPAWRPERRPGYSESASAPVPRYIVYPVCVCLQCVFSWSGPSCPTPTSVRCWIHSATSFEFLFVASGFVSLMHFTFLHFFVFVSSIDFHPGWYGITGVPQLKISK